MDEIHPKTCMIIHYVKQQFVKILQSKGGGVNGNYMKMNTNQVLTKLWSISEPGFFFTFQDSLATLPPLPQLQVLKKIESKSTYLQIPKTKI